MTLIKRKNGKTYKGKDGKEHNSYTFFLQLDNGKRIAVRNVFDDDYEKLDLVATYVER